MSETNTVLTPIVDEGTFQSLIRNIRPLEDTDEIRNILSKTRPVLRYKNGFRHVNFDKMDVRYGNLYDGPAYGPQALLREHSRILTLHRFSLYNRFEPKLREVLQLIPRNPSETVIAFEVLNPLNNDGLQQQRIALNHGYHVAQTILYTYL
jgi:hypothetical protein